MIGLIVAGAEQIQFYRQCGEFNDFADFEVTIHFVGIGIDSARSRFLPIDVAEFFRRSEMSNRLLGQFQIRFECVGEQLIGAGTGPFSSSFGLLKSKVFCPQSFGEHQTGLKVRDDTVAVATADTGREEFEWARVFG